MKKLFCILLTMAIMVYVEGVIPIATFALETIEDDNKNEFENKYNVAYYSNIGSWDGELSSTKIQTVDALKECTTDNDILSKYSESFFENKYLVWIDYGTPDPAHELRVTSVDNSENEIDIEIITSYSQNGSVIDVTCDWDILLEVESADIDKEVVVTTAEDMEHWLGDISYYEGYIKNISAPSYGMAPSVAKVNSLESLAESWSGSMSDIEKYDEAFFEENFLLFVSWIETSSLQTYQISSILDDGEKINVELSEFIPEGEGATVMTPYSAVIEVPSWLADREFSATAVELEPEPTATPIPYPTTDPSMLEYLTFDAETGTITKCDTSISGDLVIPAEIDGVTVTAIGNNAFYQCNKLTDVTVPESVTTIGNQAFYVCKKLENVTICNGVTSIGNGAFGVCTAMTDISIPDSVTSIGNDAFYYCSKLESVTIPSNLTELGDYAFKYCIALTNITIPGTLTNIPADAFYGDTNLTSVTIEDGVKSIGTNAFYSCTGLTDIELPDSVESISDNAFANCETLKKAVIPKIVTSIGANVFSGASEEFAIYGYGDSYAKTYSDENSIRFIDVTELSPTPTVIPSPTPTVAPTSSPTVEPTPQVITVESPKSDTESGIVAYGTKITISPSAHLAYSINGGEWIYEWSAETFTVIEDITITVRSWLDEKEPNVEYNLPETTYTYTVDKTTIPEYSYVIEDISLLSVSGESLTAIANDSGFIAEITINEVKERKSNDYIFVAVYGTDGQLLNLDYVKADFAVNSDCSFGFNIPAQKDSVGSIKAFIWSDFNSMEPLAESKILNMNV